MFFRFIPYIISYHFWTSDKKAEQCFLTSRRCDPKIISTVLLSPILSISGDVTFLPRNLLKLSKHRWTFEGLIIRQSVKIISRQPCKWQGDWDRQRKRPQFIKNQRRDSRSANPDLVPLRREKQSTMGQNWEKHRKNRHLKSHCPMSKEVSEVSERANDWAQRRARAKRAVRSERTSERTSKWPSTPVCILGYSGPQCTVPRETKVGRHKSGRTMRCVLKWSRTPPVCDQPTEPLTDGQTDGWSDLMLCYDDETKKNKRTIRRVGVRATIHENKSFSIDQKSKTYEQTNDPSYGNDWHIKEKYIQVVPSKDRERGHSPKTSIPQGWSAKKNKNTSQCING